MTISGKEIEGARTPSKSSLRLLMKAAVAALDPADRDEQEKSLIRRVPELTGFADATTILLFVSALPEEPRTIALFDLAYQQKKAVFCPRVNRHARRLSIHPIVDPRTDLIPGILGIPEPGPEVPEAAPSLIDWALVPGLAFDERGFRLGRGAGYYDRLLPALPPDAKCWSICFDCQLVRELPIETHDVPLDGVVTPTRIIRGTARFSGVSGRRPEERIGHR
jgi:5-formyltetrahydrofolate cyclo-ligase